MKRAFDKISAGLDDAIAYVEGDRRRAREATVDVKEIRRASGMTQAAFAEAFGLRVAALRDWEQGRRRPDTGSVTLLRMIAADPGGMRRIMAKV